MRSKGFHHSEETKRKISEANKGRVVSEETKKKIGVANRGRRHSDEARRKISLAGLGRIPWNKGLTKETDERIRKHSEALKGNTNNLGHRHSEESKRKMKLKHKGKKLSEGHKQKLSEAHMGKTTWNSGLTKETDKRVRRMAEARIGEKNPSWRGGISFESYTSDFNRELKEQIKKRDNYTCQHCGVMEDLAVHHIDYDKKNNVPLNLITLCRACNSTMNFNRDHWKTFWSVRINDVRARQLVGFLEAHS